MFAFFMFMSLGVDGIVMSSAYVVSFTGVYGVHGVEVSDVYMLINEGERTPSCETPVFKLHCVDVLFPNVVYALHYLMLFAIFLEWCVGCLFGVVYLWVSVCYLCLIFCSCLVLLQLCVLVVCFG